METIQRLNRRVGSTAEVSTVHKAQTRPIRGDVVAWSCLAKRLDEVVGICWHVRARGMPASGKGLADASTVQERDLAGS